MKSHKFKQLITIIHLKFTTLKLETKRPKQVKSMFLRDFLQKKLLKGTFYLKYFEELLIKMKFQIISD